jgi:hypothetical protein
MTIIDVLKVQLALNRATGAQTALFFLDALALSIQAERQFLAINIAWARRAQAHFLEVFFIFHLYHYSKEPEQNRENHVNYGYQCCEECKALVVLENVLLEVEDRYPQR